MFLIEAYDNAFGASNAALCANEQKRFWEYHDILFTNQAEWKNLDIEADTILKSKVHNRIQLSNR
jgi:protein-disulfide isomerase